MGKIRGFHTSPGIYTRPWSDGFKKSTKGNRKGLKQIPASGGGADKPWVFSDYFPIVFS